MSAKQFEKTDIFHNVIKTTPKYEFKIYDGAIYLNNSEGFVKINTFYSGTFP